MVVNPKMAIKIQRKTPCSNGLTPTALSVFIFRVAPIRNKVIVRPIFAMLTICGATMAVEGT